LNCDRIAGWYRWLEYLGFGRELERRRFRYLDRLSAARRALVLGDGDGRFLARLLARNAGVSADYVDVSAGMLALARERAGEARVTYHRADARTLALFPDFHDDHEADGYDLIVTHFFLDCFDEAGVRALIGRVAAAARPGALWLISEFRQPEHGWRAVWAWLWLRALYGFFEVATGLRTRRLADHRPLLIEHGFRLEQEETSRFGLLASELWVQSS
jgi:SAM-dependent methyltransferase